MVIRGASDTTHPGATINPTTASAWILEYLAPAPLKILAINLMSVFLQALIS